MCPSISEYTSYVLLSSSSIHYRHNGGDARKAHVKHLVPSITATMEEMPESHTWARHNGGDARKAHVGRSNYGESRYFEFPSISEYTSYVLLSSSSIHYCHNGGDARKAHVKHPVPSITATMEEMPERHT